MCAIYVEYNFVLSLFFLAKIYTFMIFNISTEKRERIPIVEIGKCSISSILSNTTEIKTQRTKKRWNSFSFSLCAQSDVPLNYKNTFARIERWWCWFYCRFFLVSSSGRKTSRSVKPLDSFARKLMEKIQNRTEKEQQNEAKNSSSRVVCKKTLPKMHNSSHNIYSWCFQFHYEKRKI